MMHALLCVIALAAAADESYLAWYAEPAKITALPASKGTRLPAAELAALAASKPVLPFDTLSIAVRDDDGNLWAGSKSGLMYLPAGGNRWRLFHSRRWLRDDQVEDLALAGNGEIFVKTPTGIDRLFQRPTTLEAKMLAIDELITRYHLREGMVGGIELKEPGRVDGGYSQHTNDNDGLWTSLYVAAEAFRYGVSRDPVARHNARRSLEALMFLERVTGIPGFAARSIVPIDQDPRGGRGEWHRSADNRWWWKGDTSSDEVDGHYFAYAIYYDLVADEAERNDIRQYVARITDHIIDNGLHYVGPPGVPTTWGVWSPEKLNHDLRRAGDRGLNSLEILSHLKVADHIVGKPRYAEMAKELIEKHAYEMNTVFQKHVWPVERVNHSDDELAFLAYYPLLIYERDAGLREVYLASLRRTWLIERPEHSPLFNFIYGAALQASTWTRPSERPPSGLVEGDDYDRQESLEWLRDVPQDTVGWTVTNSDRRDVVILGNNRFRRPRGQTVLPPSERAVMRWNGDPYTLDGGSEGRHRDDGTAILLPYWMGRYHRLIE